MLIRIDLKIFIFLILFFITNQIETYLLIMFFCIIHEFGHIIVGLFLKMKPDRLEIMPCGFSISFKVDPEDINFKIKNGNILEVKKVLVAMAGPIMSLILATLYTYFETPYIDNKEAIYANILIFLFNLIPIYPLDGGRIIKSLLHIKVGVIKSRIIINNISNVTMIIITAICSIGVFYFENIAIFLVCIFLWTITLQENKKFKLMQYYQNMI